MVKIILLSLNTLEHTRKCLDAIRDTLRSTEYCLHIVDQGSTDGTADYLRSLDLEKYYISQIELRAYNVGISKAWNDVIFQDGDKACYDIVLLGSDTIPHEGWLKELIKIKKSDLRNGIIASKLIKAAGTNPVTGKPRWFVCFGGTTDVPGREHLVGFEDSAPDNGYTHVKEYGWVTFSSVLLTKECINSVGKFDEDFVIWCSDRDYCYRAREKGWNIIYCGYSRVEHFESVSVHKNKDILVHLEDDKTVSVYNASCRDIRRFAEKWGGR